MNCSADMFKFDNNDSIDFLPPPYLMKNSERMNGSSDLQPNLHLHRDYASPSSESDVVDLDNYKKINLISEFESLKYNWIEDTKISSSLSIIYNHPAYKKIIEMGEEVLPLIFHDLLKNDNFWFKALRDITGVNLTNKENQGKFHILKQDWINWAKNNNKFSE